MNKKTIRILSAATASAMLFGVPVLEISADNPDATVQSYEDQLTSIVTKQKKALNELADIRSGQADVQEEINKYDELLKYNNEMKNLAAGQLDSLTEQIETKKRSIEDTTAAIEWQEEAFLERMVAVYMEEDKDWLELIVEAENLSDFLVKMERVNAIFDYDSRIIKELTANRESLETDRSALESFWDDVKPFVEYGCTRDAKFFERVKNMILYKTTENEYLTAEEYLEKNAGKGEENTMYYASDVLQQVGYIGLFREQGITVAVMDGIIDSRFLSFMEMQDKAVHFVRIDSELDKVLRAEEEAEEDEALLSVFRGVVPEAVSLKQEVMKSTKTPALITLAEEKRRLAEILRQYGEKIPGITAPEDEVTLSLNMNCPLIARIAALAKDSKSAEKAKALAKQVYMIAVISQRSFTQEELQEFIDSSIELLYNA